MIQLLIQILVKQARKKNAHFNPDPPYITPNQKIPKHHSLCITFRKSKNNNE